MRAGLVGLLLSHGRRVAAQEIWGHSPRSQGRSSCHGWTHVDRAASSPWWVTPTHSRLRSHVSLTQKVSGRACQDPSSPVPRVGGGASRQSSNLQLQPRPAGCALAPSSPDRRSSHMPAPRAAWERSTLYLEVACGVCRDGLWTTSAQTSPPSSSIHASLGEVTL